VSPQDSLQTTSVQIIDLLRSSHSASAVSALGSLNARSESHPSAKYRVRGMRDLHQTDRAGKCVSSAECQLSLNLSAVWLEAAAKLPGKSMHLAVVLLRLTTVEQTDRVVLINRACERFGLDRNAKYRALLSLEAAGLIRVQRKQGQSPIVTIVTGGASP
jgi:DNA-binding transcriptional ArsR family regulator